MTDEKLLDFKTVCERYHFTSNALRWLLRYRRIPFVRIGRGRGRIYFDPEDLRNWIEENKIKANKSI